MKHFDKKKLHNFSRFAFKNNTGLVHPTFKNIFVSKHEERKTIVGKTEVEKTLTTCAHIVVKQAIIQTEERKSELKKDGRAKDLTKEEHWLKCEDPEIAKNEVIVPNGYNVYDIINKD